MVHNEIIKKLELILPAYSGESITVWFPNGKNSIRIRKKDGNEFIFTYNNKNNWKFETIDSYIKNMKGGDR